MNILFRVDASKKIGTGHVIRCMTLAQELRSKGAEILFISREFSGHLCEVLNTNGFDVIRLENSRSNGNENLQRSESDNRKEDLDHSAWLGVDQETDAQQTLTQLAKNTRWDWLVVDHYALDARWESSMRRFANNILVIDDLADRHHDCDLLLDQNYFKNVSVRYKNLLRPSCVTLLGPKFALLRAEFRKAAHSMRTRGNGIKRVLIYYGGYDADNLTGMTLQALCAQELCRLNVDIVVGRDNPHLEKLSAQAARRLHTRLHVQPSGFVELNVRADLCVGAGGTTTWERLCLGLPSIVITVAKNQEPSIKELNEMKYIRWIGVKESVTIQDIRDGVIDEIQRLEGQGVSSQPALVDGYGALRIVERMIPSEKKKLRLRKTVTDDVTKYFYWANDPECRKNSLQQEVIDWKQHRAWFSRKIASEKTRMWVMETPDELPVGQIRFDVSDEGVANISYSLDVLVRGKGWGGELLKIGIEHLKTDDIHTIQAVVKKENTVSRKLFVRLGFQESEAGGACVFTKHIHEA